MFIISEREQLREKYSQIEKELEKSNKVMHSHYLIIFSKNLVEFYCKCCILIGYATCYLLANR